MLFTYAGSYSICIVWLLICFIKYCNLLSILSLSAFCTTSDDEKLTQEVYKVDESGI